MKLSAKSMVTDVLLSHSPNTIALIGEHAPVLVQDWLDDHDTTDVKTFADSQSFLSHSPFRVEWALVSDCLEHLGDKEGSELLGRLKNFSASKFCVLIEDGHATWNARSLSGFALEKLADKPLQSPSGKQVRAFSYDLTTYKQTPDWLNSDYWANPERWNKDFW